MLMSSALFTPFDLSPHQAARAFQTRSAQRIATFWPVSDAERGHWQCNACRKQSNSLTFCFTEACFASVRQRLFL